MKAMRKLFLIGMPVLLTVVATSTFAQSVDADRDDGTIAAAQAESSSAPEGKRQDPVAFAQQRLARLKSKLAITAEQEPQWSAFSGTVLQQMEQFKAAYQGRRPAARTAPERIDRQVAWMKERAAAFDSRRGREDVVRDIESRTTADRRREAAAVARAASELSSIVGRGDARERVPRLDSEEMRDVLS
jgi:LTXXQ motif family protein